MLVTFECGWCDMQFPHCDQRVLHAPGECKYCDCHPEWQELRRAWNINFTGHYEVGLAMCPAEAARGIGNVGREHQWNGNAPTEGRFPDAEEIEEAIDGLKAIESSIRPT